MTQTENNQIRRLYTMNNLPVSCRTDSDWGAGTVDINEYFSGETISPLRGVKKSRIGRERGLKMRTNYTRVKKCCHSHWRIK